jgi:hypothetical protein
MSYNRARAYALLIGERANNPQMRSNNFEWTEDTFGTGTKGMLRFAEELGNSISIGSFSTATLDTFRQLAAINQRNMVTTMDFFLFHSSEVGSSIQRQLLSSFDKTTDIYLRKLASSYTGADKEKYSMVAGDGFITDLGFTTVKIDNQMFTVRHMHEFNDNAGLGTDGSPFLRFALTAPMGFVSNPEMGSKHSMMRMMYRKLDGYSRETITDKWGGFMASRALGIAPSNQYDTATIAIGGHIAFAGCCFNHFINVKE